MVVLVGLALASTSGASRAQDATVRLPGLDGPVRIIRDKLGVPHVYATSDHDAIFAVGWLHAGDRFFQMDVSRRQAAGRLAELLGPSALPSDVQLRTIGLLRAAQRSLPALSPESRASSEAYAAGVNAWLARHPLPPEYRALELTKTSVPEWTGLDSMAVTKLLATGLSFDLGDIANTQRLIAYSTALGPAAGAALFSADVNRAEPFAHAPSILPGDTAQSVGVERSPAWSARSLSLRAQRLGAILARAKRAGIAVRPGDRGSNIFVVDGAHSASGHAMVASDPHLALDSPPVFYELGLDVTPGRRQERLSIYGVTFPGTPFVVHGMNEHIAWGSTVNPTDVTDVYQEQLVFQGGVPVATTYRGQQEPLVVIPETYRANAPGNGTADDVAVVPPSASVPPATFVVPRRNNGPLISVSPALSVQFTGFAPTREPDFFRLLARAETVAEARAAVRYFDFGAQNWMVADRQGSIGYFTSGEIPLREDLQAGTVNGLPPWFVRNGTGGNEWIPDPAPAEDQANRYELLPFSEMDQLANPARGWISNANQDPNGQTFDNDPLNELRPGGGIRYVTPGHDHGTRNARLSTRIPEALADGSVSFAEMQSIQADVKLHDAAVFVPYLTRALQAATTPGAPPELAALGANPAVGEAVGRLGGWDFSTPTGIVEGWDAGASAGTPPSQDEIDASVATTIYSLWRGRLIANTVDATLQSVGLGGFLPPAERALIGIRHLLETYSVTGGVGASGVNFFNVPGLASPSARRDFLLLKSVQDALALAAGPDFAPAFGGSTNQADYRWGKLHRIVFDHPLGGPFSIPPGAGFSHLAAALPGIPTDGGFGVVDASSHSARATGLNSFMFGSGPARRFVAEPRKSHPRAVQVIPGGESGTPGELFFGNQLPLWLSDRYHAATLQRGEVQRQALSVERLLPGR
ncbi:MAG TPA: penicillin acylase family protein [Gaiellaceae bacterium]|nr:penicillin acylase family protein [Gaiellaceae bacterium]